jgi:hypothetical protein
MEVTRISRQQSINKILRSYVNVSNAWERKDLGSAVHIFSHVRRTLLVEMITIHGAMEKPDISPGSSQKDEIRSYKWVTEEDMMNDAIPATLKKAFDLIKSGSATATSKNSKKASSRNSKKVGNQKKRPAKEASDDDDEENEESGAEDDDYMPSKGQKRGNSSKDDIEVEITST